MTVTIGRAGSEITIQEPMSMSLVGDRLTAKGTVDGLGADDWLALRDQLRGLNANRDEPTTRFTSSQLPSLDGFYQGWNVGVDPDPGGYSKGYLDWSFQADRVTDFAYPLIESTLFGGFRANAFAVGSGAAKTWWSASPALIDYDSAGNPRSSPTGAGTDDGYGLPAVALTTGLSRQRVSYSAVPGLWYVGSPRLRWKYGSTLREVVGRYVPRITAVASGNTPDHTGMWEVSNRIIRITPYQSGVTYGGITVEQYDSVGAAWHTVGNFKMRDGSSTDSLGLSTFTVIRNDPACVRVRVGLPGVAVTTGKPWTLDILLRRGAYYAEFVLSTPIAQTWRVNSTSGLTPFATTAGFGSTTNSTTNYTILSPIAQANSVVATTGYLGTSGAVTQFPFCIAGFTLNGGGGIDSGENAAATLARYFGPTTERVAFVSR